MRGLHQLRITGDQDALQQVARKIDRILDKGWRRDHQQEFELESQADDGSQVYCFVCSALGTRPASLLWMSDRLGVLEVTHVGPQQGGRLSDDERKRVCEEFYQRFVVLATGGMNVEIDFTEATSGLDNTVSEEAASLLRKFANGANKSNGAVQFWHDNWNAFFVAAHKENVVLDGAILRQFLTIEAGWSEERADELQTQYEAARSLLRYYDGAMSEQPIAV